MAQFPRHNGKRCDLKQYGKIVDTEVLNTERDVAFSRYIFARGHFILTVYQRLGYGYVIAFSTWLCAAIRAYDPISVLNRHHNNCRDE